MSSTAPAPDGPTDPSGAGSDEAPVHPPRAVRDAEFTAFMAQAAPALARTAWLLCGDTPDLSQALRDHAATREGEVAGGPERYVVQLARRCCTKAGWSRPTCARPRWRS